MPGAISIRCNAPWKKSNHILSQRLHLPFEQGALELAAGQVVAVLGAREVVELPGCHVVHLTDFRPDFDRIVAGGGQVADDLPPQPGAIIVVLPRNRLAGLGMIAAALAHLRPAGWLIVDGQKTDGVNAVLKQLGAEVAVDGVASRAHGKIAWAKRPIELAPGVADWRAAASARRVSSGFVTAPGMFSADQVDPGSAFLLEHLPVDTRGSAADLGAGWGALSAALITQAPDLERLDLVEADRRALAAARENIADPRARFHWADATRWGGGPYDLILSNPPFHVDRRADPALGQAFIAAAARLLRPKGKFLLVANRQLPYEAALDAAFHTWSQVAATSHYKILTATRPRSAAAQARGRQ